MRDSNVFITGGAGYLGRAILAKAEAEGWDSHFTVMSTDEEKHRKLKARFPNVRTILGDIEATPIDYLSAAMAGHDIVIHAAGVKFIRTAELNPWEAHRVNVDGSRNVALAARHAGVVRVVGISTDKAAGPANMYGLTKAIMEHLFSALDGDQSETRFATVRYGNVVGSTGSVVPVFRQQIAERGFVKITDAGMSRFWMSPFEAVQLIEDAVDNLRAFADFGWTMIARCPAMRIGDVADAVWNEAGLAGPAIFETIGAGAEEKGCEDLYTEEEAHRVELFDDDRFILHPASSPAMASKESVPAGYHSCDPVRWLNVTDFREMIREAARI